MALGVAGHHVFALGYWDHVLLHLDLRDGRVTRTVVGAVGGHASRNLVVDGRGRAFVPRVRRAGDGTLQAELAEFVPGRGEVAATALPGYFRGETPEANHGVVAVLRLADGGALFTTHHGELHRIHPEGDGPSRVEALGPVHPAGPSYAPSLFALGPPDRVAAVARTARGFQWVVRDLTGGACAADLDLGGRRDVLLYGSMAGEPGGGFYLGGWQRRDEAGGHRPLLLRVRPGD